MSILANNTCDFCKVRLPKNRPKLFCKFCSEYKHYRCHRLCKSDAQYIIDLGASYDWMCNECTLDALPVNAAERPKRDPNRAPLPSYDKKKQATFLKFSIFLHFLGWFDVFFTLRLVPKLSDP